jgi:hypothetical protein
LTGTAWPLPLPQQLTVKELIPLSPWQKQFKITEGKDSGQVVPLTSQPDFSDDKKWKLVFGNYAGILLSRRPGGALLMSDSTYSKAAVISSTNRRSLFYPLKLILPGSFGSRRGIKCTTRKPES